MAYESVSSNFRAVIDSHDDVHLRSPLNTSRKPVPKARVALCALLVALWVMGPSATFAQGKTPDPLSLQELATEFTDPLTTLPQIFLKDAYSPANFGTHVQTNQALLRAIIPRIPRFSLFPLIQLIRPTFSLVTIPSARGGTQQSSATRNCSTWRYYPGRARKQASGSGWGQRLCFQPRPPGAPSKGHGRQARH